MAEFSHEPVLLRECMEMLQIRPDGVYIDGTLGGGGHSAHILEKLGKNGLLIGLDQDRDAILAAEKRLRQVKTDRAIPAEYVIVKTNFEKMSEAASNILRARGRTQVADGILLDIGVSSYQLDEPERGFSYRYDAPLDMRMDQEAALTAETVVNTYPEKELAKLIREYGEEPWAPRIAKAICERRKKEPIRTTFALVDAIKSAIPARARRDGGHPAKQTFQAVRIAVNRELYVLERVIDEAIGLLSDQGRLCIITFHSLEDRIVKNKFRQAANPCTCPPDFPVCVCGKRPLGRLVTSKPLIASEIEQSENNRSHSAKLRVFERQLGL